MTPDYNYLFLFKTYRQLYANCSMMKIKYTLKIPLLNNSSIISNLLHNTLLFS